MKRRPKWSTVMIALAVIAALAIASPVLGVSSSIRKAIKKEVSKQISSAQGPQGPQGPQGSQGPSGPPLDTTSLTLGRSAQASSPCNPTSSSFINCVVVGLDLPRPGRVLLIGTGEGASFNANGSGGTCRLGADSSVVTGSTQDLGATGFGQATVSTTAVTDVLAAGAHTFQAGCSEFSGDFRILGSQISAVMIGSG